MSEQNPKVGTPWISELPGGISVDHLVEQASDIAILINDTGVVEGVSVNPENAAVGCLDHWIGRDFRDFLNIESHDKFERRRRSMESEPNVVPRAIQLNHVDGENWEFPVRYSIHRVNGSRSLLLFGRDMQPIAEVQQRLVAEQSAREREQQKIRGYETFYRVVLEGSETSLMVVEAESGKIRDLNSAAATLMGTTVDTLSGASLAQALEGRRRNELMDALGEISSAEDQRSVEVVARRNGREIAMAAHYFRAAGELFFLCRLSPLDETDLAGSEAAQSLAMLFNSASDAIVLTDAKGNIRDANEAFLVLTDAAQLRDVKDKPLSDFLARDDVDMKLILDTALKKGRLRSYATQMLSAVGTRANVDIAASRLQGRGGDLGFGMIIRDVTPGEGLEPEEGNSVVSEEAMRSVMDLVGTASLKSLVSATSDVVEKMCIETAVKMTGNNRLAAAELLGLSRQSLYVKLRKHGMLKGDQDES